MSNVKGFTNTPKIKEEAALWLLKIEEENPLSAEDAKKLRAWVNTSEVHRNVIMRMSKTWGDMDVLTAIRVAPEAEKESLSSKLRRFARWLLSNKGHNGEETSTGLSSLIKLTAFASVLVASVMLVGLPQIENPETGVYVTDIGEYKKHTLQDGSTLWLNSDSKVKLDYSDKFRRVSLLRGEAHFEVEKDPNRPFEVYSNDRLVRAIGTAFSVNRLQDSIEVLVSEGTVEVAIVDNILILTPDDAKPARSRNKPNQKERAEPTEAKAANVSKYLGKITAGETMAIPMVNTAIIEGDTNKVVKLNKNDIGRRLSWLDGKLVFAGESLEEVVSEISRHTTIKIDVPDPELRKMRIGGHFEAGETDKLFYILESGFGIEVTELDDNHVKLSVKQ